MQVPQATQLSKILYAIILISLEIFCKDMGFSNTLQHFSEIFFIERKMKIFYAFYILYKIYAYLCRKIKRVS
jgi:hypothetical protein